MLWGLYEGLGQKAAEVLNGHPRLIAGIATGLVVLCAAGTVAAFTLTEPFVCTEENVLYRGADVTSGETYTITGDWDNGDEITLMAYGSTQAQEMENRTETYYSGPLSEASFTVPE